MIYFFVFSISYALVGLFLYFKNWKDERPDLGGFGGKK